MEDDAPDYAYDPKTPRGRRNFITDTVGHFIGRGISKSAALRWYQQENYGVGRQLFTDLWENAKGLIERSTRIQSVGTRQQIQESVFEPTDRDFGTRYRYIASYQTYDKEGFVTTKYITADTNIIGTRGNVESMIQTSYFGEDASYEKPIAGVSIVRAFINPTR